MNKWEAQAIKHAKKEAPKESCGLVVIIKGRTRYWPCHNISSAPESTFIIDPNDWKEAEDNGEIIAIVHSHTDGTALASDTDKASCQKHGLPWYITSPEAGIIDTIQPLKHDVPLFGRQWVWGVTDCWTLVRDWYKQEMNIDLRDWQRPANVEDFIQAPMFEDCWESTGFRTLSPKEKWNYGDAVLMSINSSGLNHCGVYIGEQLIVHHLQNRLSSRDFYSQWLVECTGRRLRHVSQD